MTAHRYSRRWVWLAPLALALALFGVLLSILPSSAAGGTWYVNGDTGNDANGCTTAGAPCATIAAAIGKAASGGTIYIAAGTYIENLTVDKDLTFVGAGADVTFVDGGGAGRVFESTSFSKLILSNLTVQNGVAPSTPVPQPGGGIYVPDNGLSLFGVHVISNTGGAYAGISGRRRTQSQRDRCASG